MARPTMKARKVLDAKPTAAEIDRVVFATPARKAKAAIAPDQEPAMRKSGTGEKRTRVRVVVNVYPETLERLRNVAWTDREAASGIAEAAILAELERRERKRGGPYPARKGELRPGRRSAK